MGTLFNQKARNYRTAFYEDQVRRCKLIKNLAKECNITFDQALRVNEIMEIERRNTLYVENGDIHDEQMAGLGELILAFTEAFKDSFGANCGNQYPAFLEKTAMELEAIAAAIAETRD